MNPRFRILLAAGLLAGTGVRAQTAPDPGVGSSREDVVARYGPPRATVSAGAREIMTYAAGKVILKDGRVTRFDLPRLAPVAAQPAAETKPAPAPAAPPPPATRQATAEREPWLTDFGAAQAEAAASKRRVLALFTGSDWCPACIEFEASVAHHPDFLATTRASFVLLKLDYPMQHMLPPAQRAQNDALRKRFGISAYPTLLIISPDGTTVKVRNTVGRKADDITDYYVQAVDEARREKPGEKSWWWPF